MPAILITGIIVIIIGIVGFYIIYKPNKKKAEGLRFSLYGFLLFFCSIFILSGWQEILLYGFNIDGSFRTTEVSDDMTFRNGIALIISILAISGWTEIFIIRIKKFRYKKQNRDV